MTQKKDTKFRPGQSGNPAGRKPGSGWVGKVRTQLQEAWVGNEQDGSDGVQAKLIEAAKAGEAWAIRLVAERVCAPAKAAEEAVQIELEGETLTERATCILDALGGGTLAPGQAAQLLQGLQAMAKIIETDELVRRIAALEGRK